MIRSSAELLKREMPESSLTVLPGLYHGEFSLNHAEEYVSFVRKLCDEGTRILTEVKEDRKG